MLSDDRAPDFAIPADDDLIFGYDLPDGQGMFALHVVSLMVGGTTSGDVILFLGVECDDGADVHRFPPLGIDRKDARMLATALNHVLEYEPDTRP
jgi:hypothetical protein